MTSYEYENNTTSDIYDYSYVSMSPTLRICLMVPLNILSVACSFIILYQMLSKRALRNALNNHSIIALIITGLGTQLIDMPLYINYLRLGYVWPSTPIFCLFWWYVDIGLYEATTILVAWASLERHFLIFHEQFLSVGTKRYLFHYLPIIICIIYPLIFTIFCVIFVTCDDAFVFNYTSAWCNFSPCFYLDPFLSTYDTVMHWIMPILLISFLNIGLIIRVVWHRSIRMRQPFQWSKHRKMAAQLLSVSALFMFFNLPTGIYSILSLLNVLPEDIDPQIYAYTYLASFFSVLLMPLIIIFSLPKEYWWSMWKRVLINWRQGRRIANIDIPNQTQGRSKLTITFAKTNTDQ